MHYDKSCLTCSWWLINASTKPGCERLSPLYQVVKN
jgi:hypothetical protein